MFILALLSILLLGSYGNASCPTHLQIKNRYIVTPQDSESSTKFSTKALRSLSSSVKIIKKLGENSSSPKGSFKALSGVSKGGARSLLVEFKQSQDQLKQHFPGAFVQKDCRVQLLNTGSDPYFSAYQKAYFELMNHNPYVSKNPMREVVVAISDTGVNYHHPDLAQQVWTNTAEALGQPGIDDDGNGYVDDIHGYDFGDRDADPIPTTSDYYLDYDHGTHVAGLAAAGLGNGKGGAGTGGAGVKFMALKGFRSFDESTVSDLLETIYYAVDNGAHIINASWGAQKAPEAAEIVAINYATENGVVVVAAAGNATSPASWFTPASIESVVTVGSINSRRQLSTFSNYGDGVDFVAPGGDGPERFNEAIFSTGLSSKYLELSGTSMSAPLVAGALAHLMTQDAELTAFQALSLLKSTATVLSDLSSYNQADTRSYHLPNVGSALNLLTSSEEQSTPIDDSSDPTIQPVIESEQTSFSSEATGTHFSESSAGCGHSAHPLEEGRLPLVLALFFLPFFVRRLFYN